MGKAALQLGQEVRGLGHVERARRDEEDVVRLHRAVLGLHGGAFHDGKQVSLHALARDVGASSTVVLGGDLVHLIEKDDAGLLGALDGLGVQGVRVDEFVRFFLSEVLEGFGHLHAPALRALGHEIPHDFLHVDADLLQIAPAHEMDFGAFVRHLYLHFPIVELSLEQQGAKLLPRTLVALLSEGGPWSGRARPSRRTRGDAAEAGPAGDLRPVPGLWFC